MTCKDPYLHPSDISSPTLEFHHSLHESHLLHPHNKVVHAMGKPFSVAPSSPWHVALHQWLPIDEREALPHRWHFNP